MFNYLITQFKKSLTNVNWQWTTQVKITEYFINFSCSFYIFNLFRTCIINSPSLGMGCSTKPYKKLDFILLYKLTSGKGSSPKLVVLNNESSYRLENSVGRIASLPSIAFIQSLLPLYSNNNLCFACVLSRSLTTANTFFNDSEYLFNNLLCGWSYCITKSWQPDFAINTLLNEINTRPE